MGMNPYLSPPISSEPIVEPGYREPEEDESSLNTVLDSMLPFFQDKKGSIKLPTYRGKALIDALHSQKHPLQSLFRLRRGRTMPGQGV
jgi:hypothetical protein